MKHMSEEKMNDIYGGITRIAALYCYQNSSGDEEWDDTGREVRAQAEYLMQYAHNNGWITYDIYTDGGYAGSGSGWPTARRMLEDAADGQFNCVIVKDLSGLFPDVSRARPRIEEMFTQKGIRFIAIDDDIDIVP